MPPLPQHHLLGAPEGRSYTLGCQKNHKCAPKSRCWYWNSVVKPEVKVCINCPQKLSSSLGVPLGWWCPSRAACPWSMFASQKKVEECVQVPRWTAEVKGRAGLTRTLHLVRGPRGPGSPTALPMLRGFPAYQKKQIGKCSVGL